MFLGLPTLIFLLSFIGIMTLVLSFILFKKRSTKTISIAGSLFTATVLIYLLLQFVSKVTIVDLKNTRIVYSIGNPNYDLSNGKSLDLDFIDGHKYLINDTSEDLVLEILRYHLVVDYTLEGYYIPPYSCVDFEYFTIDYGLNDFPPTEVSTKEFEDERFLYVEKYWLRFRGQFVGSYGEVTIHDLTIVDQEL